MAVLVSMLLLVVVVVVVVSGAGAVPLLASASSHLLLLLRVPVSKLGSDAFTDADSGLDVTGTVLIFPCSSNKSFFASLNKSNVSFSTLA